MKQQLPAKIEVTFTERDSGIDATFRDPETKAVLDTLYATSAAEMMAALRRCKGLYDSSFLYPKPWPPRMSALFAAVIAGVKRPSGE
jgi:hypothetical protein